MKLFLDYPEKNFHIREISRLTKLSAPGVLKIIEKLRNEHLLVVEKGKVTVNVRVDRNEKFRNLKRVYNFWNLLDSGLLESLRKSYEEPEVIIVFGSYSKGEDISKSDIDIAVVTKKHLNLNLRNYETVLKRKINLHEIQIENCSNEFLNNLINGIILYGYLKVKK